MKYRTKYKYTQIIQDIIYILFHLKHNLYKYLRFISIKHMVYCLDYIIKIFLFAKDEYKR